MTRLGTILSTRDGGVSWHTQENKGDNLLDVALDFESKWGIVVGYNGTLLAATDYEDGWTNHRQALEQKRQELLEDRTQLAKDHRDLVESVVSLSPEESSDIYQRVSADAWNYVTLTASWRLPILVFSLFLVQVLVGLNRYNTRLAAFYFARVDTLMLLSTEVNSYSFSFEMLERGALMFSPDQVDFGRTPQTMSRHATELLTRYIGRSRPPEL